MGNCCDKIKLFDPDQDYKKLKRKCRKSGKLFEDSKFPASSNLLTGDTRSQERFQYLGRSWDSQEIKWLRPQEICKLQDAEMSPELFVGNRDRFDINQGEIGDCWFLSALSTLAENEFFLQKVIPAGQGFTKNYHGIFRFRFYRFGEWEEIVIDDRLPTRNGKLIYLRSKETNEFWSPLLEKAYAKLYGSYAALEGGVSIDAAVDFSGGIPQVLKLENISTKEEETQLFHQLEVVSANGAMISTSVGRQYRSEAESKGLESKHAYTITKVVDVKSWYARESVPLLRLRNPHGNGNEWKGDWSDGSSQWKDSTKNKVDLNIASDGEFYISFEDFLKYFGIIEIVHLNPIRMQTNERRLASEFTRISVHGEWIRGVNAGGTSNFAINPQYRMKISNKRDYSDSCSVIISLTQKVTKRKEDRSIGFRVYNVKPDLVNKPTLAPNYINSASNIHEKSGAFINYREVTKTMMLPAGHYCIMPSTYEEGANAEFLLRVWVDTRWNCKVEKGKYETVEDFQCCFVCCHYGGSCCSCCTYMCYRISACCCKEKSETKRPETESRCCKSSCCNDDDDFYQPSNNSQQSKGRTIKIQVQK